MMKFPFRKGKKMTEQNQQVDNEIPNTEEQNAHETPEQPTPTIENLQERVAELEAMLQEEQLRSLANEQNLRRRFQEELQSAHKFAAQKFATEMLIIKDYLEMALLDQSSNFDALKMGVSMTLNELNKAFEITKIKEIIVEKGEKLDPHRHQAMQEVESPQEVGTIVALMKKGYTMHDRVLRPAMVSVAKEPLAAESEAAE